MAVIADQDRGWAPPALGDPLRPRARVSVEPHDTATNLRLLDVPRFATTSGTADGVDAVFVLNLFADQRKWAEASSALARHGIVAQHWPGVNGNDAEHVDQWRDYASHGPVLPFEKQLNRRLIASPGAWGYLLSMRGLLQEAKNRRLNRIMVFDDDVLLHKDFGTLLSRAWNEIPPDWKLVYLGCTQKDWDRAVPVTDVVYQPGTAVNGSFAYMIDASVFDELLEGIDRFDWPFDSGPLCAVATRHPDQVYATRPHLAIADVRFSDIRAPRDLVRFAVEARWELGEYDVDLSHERGARPVSRALNAEDELLSVLIVVEDDEVGVAGALDSLRGQTEGRFEVVVLDNASVDRSLQVLRDRASKDTRVRLLRRDDRGTRVECLNLLVHEARGRHVLLHGSDEVSFPGRLAALRHAVESSSGVAGVRARALVVPRSPAQGTSDPHLLEAWGRQVANGTEHELLSAGLLSRLLLEEFGDLLLDGEDGVQELLRRAVLSRKAQKRDTIELAPTPEGVLSLVPVAPPAQDAEAREVARYHDELVAGLRPAHRTLLRPDVTLTAVLRPSRQEAPPDPSRATTKPSSASARV